MADGIDYGVENDLAPRQFVDVLRRSGLAERRPVDQPDRVARMLEHANLIVTAREPGGKLVAVARCLTDFAYCCYCSDIAVDREWQGRGIGRGLIRRCREEAGDGANFFLLSAPGVEDFYRRAGMEKYENCYGLRRAR